MVLVGLAQGVQIVHGPPVEPGEIAAVPRALMLVGPLSNESVALIASNAALVIAMRITGASCPRATRPSPLRLRHVCSALHDRVATVPSPPSATTAPSDRRCPRTRLCGPCRVQDGQCLIHIEAAVLDRLRAMRKLGERYSV
jgi:hypothetical protein